jgi:hypothetical protein
MNYRYDLTPSSIFLVEMTFCQHFRSIFTKEHLHCFASYQENPALFHLHNLFSLDRLVGCVGLMHLNLTEIAERKI